MIASCALATVISACLWIIWLSLLGYQKCGAEGVLGNFLLLIVMSYGAILWLPGVIVGRTLRRNFAFTMKRMAQITCIVVLTTVLIFCGEMKVYPLPS